MRGGNGPTVVSEGELTAQARPHPGPLLGSTAVLVLGMHRSGTSAVSGVLHSLGVSLGRTVSPPGPSNPRGYFENTRAMLLHEELLANLGRSWDDPRAFPEGWDGEERLAFWRARLQALLEEEFGGDRLWGVKDPRLCRLLPLWLPTLATAKVEAKAILVMRHPLAVAASNCRRTGMPREQALELWLRHLLEAERGSRGIRRTPLSYEELLRDWRGELTRVKDELGVAFDLTAGAPAVEGLLEAALDHHRAEDLASIPEPFASWVEAAWQAMLFWHREGVAPFDVFDQLRGERGRFAAATLPVAQFLQRQSEGWRRRWEEADRLPSQGEGTAWRVELEQRYAGLAGELDRTRAELRALRAELGNEQQRRQRAEEKLARLVNTTWMRLASRYWRLRACLRKAPGG